MLPPWLWRYQPDFKKIAQHVRDVIQFLRRAQAGQVESPQCHAIELPVILRRLRCQQNLPAIERRPEGVGHLASHGHGGVKVRAAYVEADLARDHGVIKAGGDAERRCYLRKQSAAIAAIVKISLGGARLYAKLFRLRHHLRRVGSSRAHSPRASVKRCWANSFCGSRWSALRNSASASI